MLAVLGMAVSLSVRPRRLFIRVQPGTVPEEGAEERSRRGASAAGGTVEGVETTSVSVAGLDRVEGRGGLAEEVAALAAACGLEATLAASDDEEAQ